MNFSLLQKRVFSAAVMAPVVLAVIYVGGYLYYAMIFVGALIAFYEWVGLAKKTERKILLSIVGFLYIGFAAFALSAFRSGFGWDPLFVLFILVWLSDIGAYAFGKLIGGSKMLPSVSPNKTWAGFAGACLFPAILIFILSFVSVKEFDAVVILYAVGIGLAIGSAGQIGDLLVSKLKRAAGVKDTSDIIPGHGGLLDRIDSLLLVSILAVGFLIAAFALH